MKLNIPHYVCTTMTKVCTGGHYSPKVSVETDTLVDFGLPKISS